MTKVSKNHSLCLGKVHETEKAFNLGTDKTRVVTLSCPVSITKRLARFVFKQYFNIDVVKINSVKVKGKVKRFKNKFGKLSDWKKLYITLDRDVEFEPDVLIKLASEF